MGNNLVGKKVGLIPPN